MTALTLLQVANTLIPLIIIPIVTRTLGAGLFGRVSYAQNIVAYLTLLVNYGFEYSATRQISLHADDKLTTQRLFWSVLTMKVALLLLSFCVLYVLSLTMSKIIADPRLYWYTALINIGIAFFPTWYLQGVQEMTKMAWFNFFIRLSGAVAVILFIHTAGQYRLYPLLLSLASVFTGIVAFFYSIRHFHLGSYQLHVATLKEVAVSGFPIFLNNLFISLYTLANMTILGLYVADSDIGCFSGAQRIVMAINAFIILPVSTALFPEMSRRMSLTPHEGLRFFRYCLLSTSCVAALVSALTFVFAPLIVRLLLGQNFTASIALLRWMSPLPLLVMTAQYSQYKDFMDVDCNALLHMSDFSSHVCVYPPISSLSRIMGQLALSGVGL
jgi:PST family polysaccharide transporter